MFFSLFCDTNDLSMDVERTCHTCFSPLYGHTLSGPVEAVSQCLPSTSMGAGIEAAGIVFVLSGRTRPWPHAHTPMIILVVGILKGGGGRGATTNKNLPLLPPSWPPSLPLPPQFIHAHWGTGVGWAEERDAALSVGAAYFAAKNRSMRPWRPPPAVGLFLSAALARSSSRRDSASSCE